MLKDDKISFLLNTTPGAMDILPRHKHLPGKHKVLSLIPSTKINKYPRPAQITCIMLLLQANYKSWILKG